jgi:hypothetical protein
VGSVFLSKAGQQRYEFTKIVTLREFSSKSNFESNLVENLRKLEEIGGNWRNLWPTPQRFAMTSGKTDLRPFRKLSYSEFDCNWNDFAFAFKRGPGAGRPQGVSL